MLSCPCDLHSIFTGQHCSKSKYQFTGNTENKHAKQHHKVAILKIEYVGTTKDSVSSINKLKG